MGAEYELKFAGTPQAQAAILADFPGLWETLVMETTYYDTPSGALSARKYTLRRRLENGSSICTLKTPGEGNLRGEWQVPGDDIRAAVPELCKLGCPSALAAMCEEGLIAICGAAFTRQALVLELPGCTAELALDQGILFGGKGKMPLCEMELELKSGSRQALDSFSRDFAAEYALKSEEKSKFARALSLYREV